MMRIKIILFTLLFFFFSNEYKSQVNPTNRQVVLQGFWWDYWNSNFPNGWSNYLAELAPRLKELGIDAIWIPPSIKNTGTNSVGYAPFDHYDLGDKYQKNSVKTRMGDKDELLRMVAVMKANGIDVIQDIVLNHITGAGSASNGGGGQDATAMDDGTTNKFKNFRYACFATPAVNETATNYLNRAGRFSKNWQNFYPNNNNICCTNDIDSPFWGPDISYESNAFGISGNAIFNPSQSNDYMRSGIRNWLIWYKKQVGWDGVRIDAVKHFPTYAAEDFLWNLQNNALWANGTNEMFAVGEWVGNSAQLDAWANNVQNRAGTFDFSLRFALSDIITGNGNFDLGSIPAAQQTNRLRTVPFVNNHDTYRPQLDALGNYTGWNAGSQIGTQIEPNDPRSSIAYAISMSVDGAPEIFFEDLFNIGYLGNRFNHHPTNNLELTTFSDVQNIIWCHQNLHFKEGAYMVRSQLQDALVIERQGKALIGVNDHFTNWQNLTGIQTSFSDGTILADYSGANGTTTQTVYGGGLVNISIPPCNGTAAAGRKGYSIWAPQGILTNYLRPSESITQEWEMEDDLGDSGVASLQQGGRLPTDSRDCRVVGRIFTDSATSVSIDIYPQNSLDSITIEWLDKSCNVIDTIANKGNFNFATSANYDGWHTIRIRNTSDNQVGQKCFVKVNYTAPAVIQSNVMKNKCACDNTSGSSIYEIDNQLLNIYPNPANDYINVLIPEEALTDLMSFTILDSYGNIVKEGWQKLGDTSFDISIQNLVCGLYFIRLRNSKMTINGKFVKTD